MSKQPQEELWLVGMDFSKESFAAANEAARLVSRLGGALRLVHVHKPIFVKDEFSTGETTYQEEQKIRSRLEEAKAALEDRFGEMTIHTNSMAGDSPSETLLDEAHRHGARRIVVGTHGRSGLMHLLLGSVAENIVRNAKVPVLVVKPEE